MRSFNEEMVDGKAEIEVGEDGRSQRIINSASACGRDLCKWTADCEAFMIIDMYKVLTLGTRVHYHSSGVPGVPRPTVAAWFIATHG